MCFIADAVILDLFFPYTHGGRKPHIPCFAFSTEQIGIFSHQFHHFRSVKLPDTYIGNITDDAHGIFHTFKEVLQFLLITPVQFFPVSHRRGCIRLFQCLKGSEREMHQACMLQIGTSGEMARVRPGKETVGLFRRVAALEKDILLMHIAPVGEKAEGFLQHEVSPVYIFRGKAIAFRFCKTEGNGQAT